MNVKFSLIPCLSPYFCLISQAYSLLECDGRKPYPFFMYLEKYDLRVSPNYISFRFISEGKNGKISKGIIFSPTENSEIWNLGFGDIHEITGQISDTAISDNGDSEKILATVAQSVILFTERNSNIFVYAKGSTLPRTRLYRIGIS